MLIKSEQLSVGSLIKNVMLKYLFWASYILRLCAQTCTPNRHALKISCLGITDNFPQSKTCVIGIVNFQSLKTLIQCLRNAMMYIDCKFFHHSPVMWSLGSIDGCYFSPIQKCPVPIKHFPAENHKSRRQEVI